MEHTDVTFIAHLERGTTTPSVWWIESPQVPGLYAAADELQEAVMLARESAMEALGDALGEVRWELADPGPDSIGDLGSASDASDAVAEGGVETRRVAVPA